MLFLDAVPTAGSGHFWDRVRIVAQITSYAGTAAATVLSVYAMLHKATLETTDPNAPLKLTGPGRKYLAAFLIISTIAVTSTILKDVADDRLKKQADEREAEAKETARKELLSDLGTDFANFAREKLSPALEKSVKALNSSLAGTSSQIKQSMIENSEETSSANIQIGSYELEIELPDGRAYPSNKRSALTDGDEEFVMKSCGQLSLPRTYDEATCDQLWSAFGTRKVVAEFFDGLHLTHGDGLDVILSFPFLLTNIHVIPKCRLLIGIAQGDRAGRGPCVQAEDNATLGSDPALVQIMPPSEVSFSEWPGPRLRYRESGSRWSNNTQQVSNFRRKYGRDVELQQVQLNLTVSPTSMAGLSPKTVLPTSLSITETLNPIPATPTVERSYTLSLKRYEKVYLDAREIQVQALYTRY